MNIFGEYHFSGLNLNTGIPLSKETLDRILSFHSAYIPIKADIKSIEVKNLPKIDFIITSFPCTNFSKKK